MSVSGPGCAACDWKGCVPWSDGAPPFVLKPCDACGGFSQFGREREAESVDLAYPRATNEMANLREVAPYLYVGNALAPTVMEWGCVVDWHGRHRDIEPARIEAFARIPIVLRVPFDDGDAVPTAALSVPAELYRIARAVRRPMLVSCAAGCSRSVSVAYAVVRDVDGASHDEALRRTRDRQCGPFEDTLASARMWVEDRSSR